MLVQSVMIGRNDDDFAAVMASNGMQAIGLRR